MFTKTAHVDASIIDYKFAPWRYKQASLKHFSEFDNYRTHEGYLYARVRAISSRINKNYDSWPTVELAGSPNLLDKHLRGHQASDKRLTLAANKSASYGFSTFLGKPIFVDHNNSDPSRARGVVADSKFHIEPFKIAKLDPFYSTSEAETYHFPPSWVELLLEIDSHSFPKFAQAIIDGANDSNEGIDGFSMGCFIPGTPITLSDGTQKPIDAIAVGDEVITHTGKTENVTFIMKKSHKGVIYDIETYGQNNHMILTEEHPIWVLRKTNLGRRKSWESESGQCKCGKYFDSRQSLGAHIREVRKHNLPGEHNQSSRDFEGWIEAKDVKVGDYVLTPAIDNGGHPGNYAFARLLGYYLAEGNLMYDKKRFSDKRPVSVEWTFNENEIEYQQEILLLLEALGYRGVGPYVKNNAASIRCNSPELALKFRMYGGEYFNKKKIHSEVLRWDKENQRALLFAYFNGDGCYRNNKTKVQASTGSENLARQLHLISINCDIPMTPPIYQMSPSMEKMKNSPRYIMQAVLEKTERAKNTNQLAFVNKQGLWRRITAITIKEYEGFVYNFDVEGDDSYIAADIAVHNCNVLKTACNICGNIATEPNEFCQHVLMKGASFKGLDSKTGKRVQKKAAEKCMGCQFFELSGVFDPADETALTKDIRTARKSIFIPKKAQLEPGFEEQYEPPMASNICPECGSPMTTSEYDFEPQCPTCGYSPSQEMDMGVNLGGDLPYGNVIASWNNRMKTASFLKGSPDAGDDEYFGGEAGSARKAYDSMIKQYGKEKGEEVYYATRNKHKGEKKSYKKKADGVTTPANTPQIDLQSAPQAVNTLREQKVCPVCGTPAESSSCEVCFLPGTLIRTKSGYKPIEDVYEGEEVLTKSGFRKVQIAHTNFWNGNIQILDGPSLLEPIRTTPNHPFSTIIGHHENRTVPCKRDRCERHSKFHDIHKLEWAHAECLSTDSYIATNVLKTPNDLTYIKIPSKYTKCRPKGSIRSGQNTLILTPDILWAIGLYLAEGCAGDRSIYYCLHAKEKSYQERLIRIWSSLDYNSKLILRSNKPNSAQVVVYSSKLSEWFPVWLGRGCENKIIPSELFNLPNEKIKYLYQGLIDGDGCEAANDFHTTSPILALQVAEIAQRLDNCSSINGFHEKGKKKAYKVLNVTRKRFCYYKPKLGRKIRVKNTWRFDNTLLYRINKISSEFYKGPVYNLTMEGDDPTYTVQNILVHNCGYTFPPESLDNPNLDKAKQNVKQNLSPVHGPDVIGQEDPRQHALQGPPPNPTPPFPPSPNQHTTYI